MRILITAGNTQVLIDKVRCLTNIFTGRTGTRLAWQGHQLGHTVTLLTSHPEVIADYAAPLPTDRWTVKPFRTFEDLQNLMAAVISQGNLDAIIHCAAVSDFLTRGIYAPGSGTTFDPNTGHWLSSGIDPPELLDRLTDKIKSAEPELWLHLVRAPKLVDRIRTDWGFPGILVKFKLEVNLAEEQLLTIAEESRRHSQADFMVANTLEGMASWAYLGPIDGKYHRVHRQVLAPRLFEAMDRLRKERDNG
ncbi:MAG TPA: phosphopantothenoylcysteine decarboxylase [Gemmataceae bacterium]|nr:phosphopantothenoylcysteine decarboxylase [Gemmataceae bacterium]